MSELGEGYSQCLMGAIPELDTDPTSSMKTKCRGEESAGGACAQTQMGCWET